MDEPLTWSDFGPDAAPTLRLLMAEALNEEWWTWPEAIAWIGSRDRRSVATLRYWVIYWQSEGGSADPTVLLAAQADIAGRYDPNAEKRLAAAITRGAVTTSGRPVPDAPARPIDKNHWRGGTIVYDKGSAQLVSVKMPLAVWSFDVAVNRTDLVSCFPEKIADGGRPGALTPTNTHIKGPNVQGRRGRAKGTGYQRADALLLADMVDAIEKDPSLNPTSAARQVAGKGKGASFEAIVDRLARAYRAERKRD